MKNPMACTHCHWIGDIVKCRQQKDAAGILADVFHCPRCDAIVEPIDWSLRESPKRCECTSVQPQDDGTWRCMLCRRSFLPTDNIPALFERGMKAKNAQVSTIGNLLVVVMPVPKEMEE